MTYQITRSNGTALTTIADRTVDSTTSLSLVGRGSIVFGQATAENFVYLLENFANATPPNNPLVGQLWFDSGHSTLTFYNGQKWLPVATDGALGDTLYLEEGTLLSGLPSGPIRYAGTIGIVLSNGNNATTVGVSLSEGQVIAATSSLAIPYNLLPLQIMIAGAVFSFRSLFPTGLVAGYNLANNGYQYSGSNQFSEIISQLPFLYSADDAGSVNQIVVNVPAPITEYQEYIVVQSKVSFTNTNATTLNLNGLGERSVTRRNGSPLGPGDLVADSFYDFLYDGAKFVVLTALASDDASLSEIAGIETQLSTVSADVSQITSEISALQALTLSLGDETSTLTLNLQAQSATSSAAIQDEATVRANADSALAQQIVSLTASTGTNIAQLLTTATTYTNTTNSLAQQITQLQATVASGPSQASLTQEIEARANADQALSEQLATLTATVGQNTTTITENYTALSTTTSSMGQVLSNLGSIAENAQAAVTTEATTRASADQALSQQITALTATVNNNNATLTTTQTTQASNLSALSSELTTLTTTVGQNTASLNVLAETVNGTQVEYQIQGTVNNVTGGLILTGVAKPGGATFNLEIDSNVTINGSLLVNGSVIANALRNESLVCQTATDTLPYGTIYLIRDWASVTNTLPNSVFSNGILTIGQGDQGLYSFSYFFKLNIEVEDFVIQLNLNNSESLTYSEGYTEGADHITAVAGGASQYLNVGDQVFIFNYFASSLYPFNNTFLFSHFEAYKVSS